MEELSLGSRWMEWLRFGFDIVKQEKLGTSSELGLTPPQEFSISNNSCQSQISPKEEAFYGDYQEDVYFNSARHEFSAYPMWHIWPIEPKSQRRKQGGNPQELWRPDVPDRSWGPPSRRSLRPRGAFPGRDVWYICCAVLSKAFRKVSVIDIVTIANDSRHSVTQHCTWGPQVPSQFGRLVHR